MRRTWERYVYLDLRRRLRFAAYRQRVLNTERERRCSKALLVVTSVRNWKDVGKVGAGLMT